MKKSKTLLFLLFASFIMANISYSQLMDDDENNNLKKIYVAISPFTQSESVPEHATEKAYSAVMDAITQNTRFELVDRRELDKLAEEKAFQQSSEDAKNTFKLESGELTGAAYYITGNVTEYFTFPADRKAKKYFKASYKVQLRFINIQTGKIMYSELLTARNSANVALGGKDYRAHRDDPITFEIKNYKLFSYPTEVLAKQDIERVIPVQ